MKAKHLIRFFWVTVLILASFSVTTPRAAGAGALTMVSEKTSTPQISGMISAGAWHNCGTKTDSTLGCWGQNDNRQATPPSGAFTQLSAGKYHTHDVRNEDTPACRDRNPAGR